ncbi:hypothetical protein [Tropicibacter oceani]|uniref:Transcription factor zinc-finger domain-containing protein n=1 Tax=Tropicibacter oceani TaxID=3058420 RepID=A0ABY8QEW5_9RHOB|nr:hypothetical protein [Tropicibacter oceani]WGW03054.1 hypothetical protein QF118_14100 [Tropicibacter oceani]
MPKMPKTEDGRDICPHCGAVLLTRTDYRNHLTLQMCSAQSEGGLWPKELRGAPERPGWDDSDMAPPKGLRK